VPQLATRTLDLDKLVEEALNAHRDELLDLIRERIGAHVDVFVGEVLASLSGHENGAAKSYEVDAPTVQPEVPTSKRCNGRGKVLPLERFPSHARRRDGHEGTCRGCRNRARTERRRTPAAPLGDGPQSTPLPAATAATS
jgi:hypothetical protein